MPKHREQPAFAPFGNDVKEARKALGLSRNQMSELLDIDSRYLANIENSGSLPSLPVFHTIVSVCKLPVERYFYPKPEEKVSAQRKRVGVKLALCPERFLTIVESTIDGIQKTADTEETR